MSGHKNASTSLSAASRQTSQTFQSQSLRRIGAQAPPSSSYFSAHPRVTPSARPNGHGINHPMSPPLLQTSTCKHIPPSKLRSTGLGSGCCTLSSTHVSRKRTQPRHGIYIHNRDASGADPRGFDTSNTHLRGETRTASPSDNTAGAPASPVAQTSNRTETRPSSSALRCRPTPLSPPAASSAPTTAEVLPEIDLEAQLSSTRPP